MSRNVVGTLEVSNLSRADSVALAGTIDNHCKSELISGILTDAIGAAGLLNELQPLLQTPSAASASSRRLTQIYRGEGNPEWPVQGAWRDTLSVESPEPTTIGPSSRAPVL
jgi:hypothetical protein